jgi:hypothetical protein
VAVETDVILSVALIPLSPRPVEATAYGAAQKAGIGKKKKKSKASEAKPAIDVKQKKKIDTIFPELK